MMKTRTMILSLLLVAGLSASAQQLRFGVLGGANISASSKYYDSRAGFHVGAKAEMDASCIGKGFFFDASLMLTQKSMKNSWGIGDYMPGTTGANTVGVDQTLTPTYLQLPVHFGYKFAVGDAVSLFVKGGPYVALGLFGKDKREMTAGDGIKTTESKNLFPDQMNRFDWGLGFRVGAEFLKHYQVSVGHDWGLKNFGKNGGDAKHRVFTISVGYMF